MNVPPLIRSAVLVCAALLATANVAAAQGFKWWQDDSVRRELGLTPEQSTRLEDIFQKSLPNLRRHMDALDRAQAEFDRLVEKGEDSAVMEQVGVVEGARAELNKARTMMLLRMRRSLTADQWARFTAVHEQRERARGATRRNHR